MVCHGRLEVREFYWLDVDNVSTLKSLIPECFEIEAGVYLGFSWPALYHGGKNFTAPYRSYR